MFVTGLCTGHQARKDSAVSCCCPFRSCKPLSKGCFTRKQKRGRVCEHVSKRKIKEECYNLVTHEDRAPYIRNGVCTHMSTWGRLGSVCPGFPGFSGPLPHSLFKDTFNWCGYQLSRMPDKVVVTRVSLLMSCPPCPALNWAPTSRKFWNHPHYAPHRWTRPWSWQ